MNWTPNPERYEKMKYNRCGKSGLKLPAISLGLWHNFGDDVAHQTKQAICRQAFDLGITHFDLANNYGPPPGSAESAFGRILREDFAGYRDQLIISSKAGYNMWPGPYGEWGSRKYLISSCDQSLKRMGLDYVDIFYSHRFDPDTPLEETMMALDHIVRSGRALYAGISSYNSHRTREAAAILKELGTPCLIHQPSYSMLNRWIEEDGLPDTLDDLGIGSIVFSPLAQGMLTDKYLKEVPEGSRATLGKSLRPEFLNEKNLANIRALNAIAQRRGQTLAQMAIAWVLRNGRITSALIGASRPEQVVDSVRAIENSNFTEAELAEIDKYARDASINIWAKSAELS
ncbi:L-glyceraldehyde 3-phosphate reductase [Arcticibacter tournemirensis]|uniref:L-glyceraldehyde 3-phosphate reductase n=1 Tax=Arcticibacter tournemirensis TaxID=699437 RepID=A0A5M9HEA5_9SPHI|nr:L-glyceraldehyde 3-phosphate reductase [Arcticibacter tournemirensis]KAA8483664.1 L-glyceraldehyde 3-phosphate reductase [Arcticibacter tournemirensis]TQM51376.1 L-glyceraldehyde 3-phosphate reductase [Arcticibacter tournemirensis]